jgi:hypothetical protein
MMFYSLLPRDDAHEVTKNMGYIMIIARKIDLSTGNYLGWIVATSTTREE